MYAPPRQNQTLFTDRRRMKVLREDESPRSRHTQQSRLPENGRFSDMMPALRSPVIPKTFQPKCATSATARFITQSLFGRPVGVTPMLFVNASTFCRPREILINQAMPFDACYELNEKD